MSACPCIFRAKRHKRYSKVNLRTVQVEPSASGEGSSVPELLGGGMVSMVVPTVVSMVVSTAVGVVT